MRSEEDEAKHRSLVEELVELFRHEEYDISGADGVEGYYPPVELQNDGYGDQDDKTPDVYAFDKKEKRYIIGEAKTGKEDFESEHSLTQYNVFVDQIHQSTNKRALFYIIVPSSRAAEFNTLITHYIHYELWGNIVVVQSRRWKE
jgi:hypothetical protein